MSITEESRVGATECGQRNGFQETYERVKEYLSALPPPFGKLLRTHASSASHEDVADVAVHGVQVPSIMSSSPPESIGAASVEGTSPLRPPVNFGTVEAGHIYRSGYPQVDNFGYLKSLGLKTILTLVPEKISPEYETFMKETGIQHFQVHIPANKGAVRIGACDMSRALEIVLDRRNHPMLIHCNKGKHRTGCVVGCFRRLQGEDSEAVFREYHFYAGAKARLLDEAFIEQFDENTVLWMARRYGWVPPIEPPSPVSIQDSQ